MASTTSHKGQIAVSRIVAELVERGVRVSLPFQEDSPYDLVAEFDRKLYRLQVKYAGLQKGRMEVRTAAPTRKTLSKNWSRQDYVGEVDLFAVYCPDAGCYLIPIEDATKTVTFLRVTRTKNNQQQDVRWAVDYELGSVVTRLLGEDRMRQAV